MTAEYTPPHEEIKNFLGIEPIGRVNGELADIAKDLTELLYPHSPSAVQVGLGEAREDTFSGYFMHRYDRLITRLGCVGYESVCVRIGNTQYHGNSPLKEEYYITKEVMQPQLDDTTETVFTNYYIGEIVKPKYPYIGTISHPDLTAEDEEIESFMSIRDCRELAAVVRELLNIAEGDRADRESVALLQNDSAQSSDS